MSAFKFINRTTGVFTDLNDALGIMGHLPVVGGRLCLATSTPFVTANTTGNTTIFFTPYMGNTVPIYNGSNFDYYTFSETSQATTDATLSPSACGNNLNYDMFAWISNGSVVCTRGPDWTQGGGSATARGTGAGSTQIQLLNGIWVNKVAITNGPAATQGTYIGTIRTNGSAQVDFNFNASGTTTQCLATLGLWNYYNRKQIQASSHETTNGYTYNSATIRERNNNTGNARIQFVVGIAEDFIDVHLNHVMAGNAAPARAYSGIQLDNNNGMDFSLSTMAAATANVAQQVGGTFNYTPQLGFHFLCFTEKAESANAVTFYQDVADWVIFWY